MANQIVTWTWSSVTPFSHIHTQTLTHMQGARLPMGSISFPRTLQHVEAHGLGIEPPTIMISGQLAPPPLPASLIHTRKSGDSIQKYGFSMIISHVSSGVLPLTQIHLLYRSFSQTEFPQIFQRVNIQGMELLPISHKVCYTVSRLQFFTFS